MSRPAPTSGRTSLVIMVAGIVMFLGIHVYVMVHPQSFECAECETAADCDDGMRCEPFSDGQHRCVHGEMMCQQGHVNLSPWWLFARNVAGVIAGLAFAWRVTRQKLLARQGPDDDDDDGLDDELDDDSDDERDVSVE